MIIIEKIVYTDRDHSVVHMCKNKMVMNGPNTTRVEYAIVEIKCKLTGHKRKTKRY